jgi:hypothetical protein
MTWPRPMSIGRRQHIRCLPAGQSEATTQRHPSIAIIVFEQTYACLVSLQDWSRQVILRSLGRKSKRGKNLALQRSGEFLIFLDARRFVRAGRCLPPLQCFQRVGVVAANVAKALIGVEEVSDRRRVLGKALDHPLHPGIHRIFVSRTVDSGTSSSEQWTFRASRKPLTRLTGPPGVRNGNVLSSPRDRVRCVLDRIRKSAFADAWSTAKKQRWSLPLPATTRRSNGQPSDALHDQRCRRSRARPAAPQRSSDRHRLHRLAGQPCLWSPLRADTTSARSPHGPHSGASIHTTWAAVDGLVAQADARSKRCCQTNRG